MSLKVLAEKANEAIEQIDRFIAEQHSSDFIESIKRQIAFIRDNAVTGKNPIAELKEGNTFSFGIMASRELASPRELELGTYISAVLSELMKLD